MSLIISGLAFLSSFVPQQINPLAPSSDPGRADVNGQSFDYVIVGGGLTGLTVANRLSEDSSRKCADSPGSCHLTHPRYCARDRKWV